MAEGDAIAAIPHEAYGAPVARPEGENLSGWYRESRDLLLRQPPEATDAGLARRVLELIHVT